MADGGGLTAHACHVDPDKIDACLRLMSVQASPLIDSASSTLAGILGKMTVRCHQLAV